MDISRFRVPPDAPRFRLADVDPRSLAGYDGDKAAGLARLVELVGRIEAGQELLYADGRHALLVVFQAMDAGGKDGTIRVVFDGVNPQGVRVASFKRPTEVELGHDFLWRVHAHAPHKGEIGIFNRSHYEDVLVVRVHGLVPEQRWRRRYRHIREFERALAEEGTTIVKFFLHVSPEEQKERLEERLANPAKRWKFAKADLAERARWPEYQAAYEEMLTETSTPWAPWYVVPADRNWFRNLVVASVVVDAIDGLGLRFPEPEEDLDDVVVT